MDKKLKITFPGQRLSHRIVFNSNEDTLHDLVRCCAELDSEIISSGFCSHYTIKRLGDCVFINVFTKNECDETLPY